MKYKYERICFGGTFDLPLHKGHRELIEKAFSSARFCVIGLTTDRFVKMSEKKESELIKRYSQRRSSLMAHLNIKGYDGRYAILPLESRYEPSMLKDEKYCDAIAVSMETFPVAMEINRFREKNGLKPLGIIQIDMVLAEDGIKISSLRIRHGEIDGDGNLLFRKS
jgi:pantetheine-phosphate adenylyltransferase